jgi:hypothetical protein
VTSALAPTADKELIFVVDRELELLKAAGRSVYFQE